MSVTQGLEVLRTTAELEALVSQWRELWSQDPNAKPFQRPEWLLSWWHHFGQPDLYVICMRHAGQLIGLLPLYVYADPQRNERQLLLLGAGTSDYLDGLFAPTCTPADLREALAAIAEQKTWDIAHFTQLLPHSLLHAALAQLDRATVHRYPGESCSRCPALPIAELPKKVRSDVRYFRNAAIGRGKLRMDIADASSWEPSLEALITLHSARWQESNQAGVLADPDVLAWHHEAIPLLQAAGCLRLYVLYLDAEPIAALYALIDPPTHPSRTECYYLVGHSPAHAELKPGTLVTAMASEYAANEGVRFIDMLRGDEAYKKFWHVEKVPTFGFSIPRDTLARR
jgi:CelD/BcsL family acetyltransferase involved in cellulose biosynthesis